MTKILRALFVVAVGLQCGPMAGADYNLLLNSQFGFSSFDNSREAKAQEYRSGSVPFWDQGGYSDVEVYRAPRNGVFRPRFLVDGVAVLHPGKSLRQFALLSELGLNHGDRVSLSVFGYQASRGALRARISQMQLDNAPGEWSPQQYGQTDARTFPKYSRGELVPVVLDDVGSGEEEHFELKVEGALISGEAKESPKESNDLSNTIGLQVEFTNTSEQDVWIYSPCLIKGSSARNQLPDYRKPPGDYRHLPKTISKLRRGEPLHIMVLGSSIDRGSANPPLYLYDENPASVHFKTPISKGDLLFDGESVGHPEWTPYIGQWRHYFSYAGRLRLSLMRRFHYSIDNILLNFMAADGSSISESHSGLEAWAGLKLPPDPEGNGHKNGRTWEELYPKVFSRPQGPTPDLVVFGSGANEKVDGPEEVAIFEGAIRWFQRHYPDVEIVFCMWQDRESYTPNTGMLKDLALRYGIPFIDIGRALNLSTYFVNSYALTPSDGHPQAAAHYIWSQFLERAFQPVDPIEPGIEQRMLPQRASVYSIGWEGETVSYERASPRINQGMAFILDDTTVNLWAGSRDKKVGIRVNGESRGGRCLPMTSRDPRNSTFAIGRLALGDQHVIEVTGDGSHIVAADCKIPVSRIWHGVSSKGWHLNGIPLQPFTSQWGAPYGTVKAVLNPGQKARMQWIGTDLSVAWLSAPDGGLLSIKVDGAMKRSIPTNQPFMLASGRPTYMENRKGIANLPYGAHQLEIEALDRPVALLGAFTYDTRPNLSGQRSLQGSASPGDIVVFPAPFKATPIVTCSGGLRVGSLSKGQAIFEGSEAGIYHVVGE